jgi:hypothetical protein
MMRKTGKAHDWSKGTQAKNGSFCHRCGMDKPTDPKRLAEVERDCHPTRLPGF